ncbi:hypothetical protein [Alteribacillus sp. YIM 98480]|uniref:hypothetical protein n=1 Tax=Alteribacillus sp. YIM 98480 TaxID=2606599 RepID=UPI00131C9384|nr:hypothetical protein [Alteribacillus sp. YIM 98480]
MEPSARSCIHFYTLFQEIVVFMILEVVAWAFHCYVGKLVRLKRGRKAGLVLIYIGGLMTTMVIMSSYKGYLYQTSS